MRRRAPTAHPCGHGGRTPKVPIPTRSPSSGLRREKICPRCHSRHPSYTTPSGASTRIPRRGRTNVLISLMGTYTEANDWSRKSRSRRSSTYSTRLPKASKLLRQSRTRTRGPRTTGPIPATTSASANAIRASTLRRKQCRRTIWRRCSRTAARTTIRKHRPRGKGSSPSRCQGIQTLTAIRGQCSPGLNSHAP